MVNHVRNSFVLHFFQAPKCQITSQFLRWCSTPNLFMNIHEFALIRRGGGERGPAYMEKDTFWGDWDAATDRPPMFLKGTVSDSNNIFLWQKIGRYYWKKLISKISVDSNISFTSYAWLCALILLCRLLCWINSQTWEFLGKMLLFHLEIFSAKFLLGNEFLRGEL